MQKIITVRFFATQNCEDLFKNVETGKVYARQPSPEKGVTYWYTTSKWSGGYEASGHIKAGIVMRVVDTAGNILFEEELQKINDSLTFAYKKGPFMSEAIKSTAHKYANAMRLTPHQDWRKILTQEKDKVGYAGYIDNWLYAEHNTTHRAVIDTVSILGKEKKIVTEKCRHKLCGLEWLTVIVTDESTEITEEICGYLFIK